MIIEKSTNQEITLRTIRELRKLTFNIPHQQRGYKWTSQNVRDLIADLYEFIHSKESKRVYCLQPLAFTKKSDNTYTVLDGQQRLTTLFLLQRFLYDENPYNFIFERDETLKKEDRRWYFLQNIPCEECEKKVDKNIDFFFIYNAYTTIEKCFSENAEGKDRILNIQDSDQIEVIKNEFRKLLNSNITDSKSVQIIWYVVPHDKEHNIFRNLNSRKIGLTNTELIKALLLNRVSGLPEGMREEAAAQFEQIERYLQDNKFWYMLQHEDGNGVQMRESKKVRTDLLFNLVSGVKKVDYNKDSLLSFYWFADSETGTLIDKWQQVRHTFYRLLDMYSDVLSYHYIGYLSYYHKDSNSYDFLKNLLNRSRTNQKSKFIALLRKDIRTSLSGDRRTLSDFYYDRKMVKELRRLFLLHNIETLNLKYQELKENQELKLQVEYERFPFELLHHQDWDIEHIASQTDNKMENAQDRKDWYESIKTDNADYFKTDLMKSKEVLDTIEDVSKKLLATIRFYEDRYSRTKKLEDFMLLYNAVIRYHDSLTPDSIKDEDKNRVGNLTLLDSHTNRGYHNALFPKKRRYIIISNGLKSKNDRLKLRTLYIPPCTIQCFTKSYSKDSCTNLNEWLQQDVDAYEADIAAKLCDSSDGKIKRFLLDNY